MSNQPKYPGTRITSNGNILVSYYTEARIAEAGIFYPITPSTEMGENFQLSFANGELNVFGQPKIALETEGEHAAQSGAIAASVAGKRVANFTSGQGIPYGSEPYYHAPAKLSTMVLNVAARALTKSALNVHCGHDDVYAVLDTGWTMLFAKDAQQAADQSMILRKVNELTLNPGINIQDGFLTSHLERTFLIPEADLIREFLGRSDDIIDTPTEAQRELFGPKRRRLPAGMDLKNPALNGPVQNQEHYMNGVIARRNNFIEPILEFLEAAYEEFAQLTGRRYGLISQYNCEKSDTLFVSLGSSAENIEAAVDYIKENHGEDVGVVHLNVIRPFPEAAVINALKGKKNVIVLERMDDQTASDNPMARDIRTALSKALTNSKTNAYDTLPTLTEAEMPRIFSGVYGLGSRDFRPEGVFGAYEFATGKLARNDGKKSTDGVSFFYVGVDHPYGVCGNETPSLLPEGAVAIRFHSIGGWGAITTGKNLGEIIGSISEFISERDECKDENGNIEEVFHISANPKYGSEKKGAPTNYFLVSAPERIRVNCDLKHVDVVLCCDPRAFTHTNPLEGMKPGGALIIETEESTSAGLWSRIPKKHRQWIIEHKIRIYGLAGFKVAQSATDRVDLQFRMQGNSFLGAFFKVSPILKDYNIPEQDFLKIVNAQYHKKFGRFGDAVVESNMTVMTEGFEGVWQAEYGAVDAEDRSSMRASYLKPASGAKRFDQDALVAQSGSVKAPYLTLDKYNSEFRAGLGYHQPASPLASTGVMAAATAATISKYVSRRMVPIFYPENCTQCMACITSCPDTALPNTIQDISTILATALKHYVTDSAAQETLSAYVGQLDESLRAKMLVEVKTNKNSAASFNDLLKAELTTVDVAEQAKEQLLMGISKIPLAYAKSRPVFELPEKKKAGSGGLFSILVSDLCKGCGECVVECGDHRALKMVQEDDFVNAEHLSSMAFLDLLPDTPNKFMGKCDADNLLETKAVALQNHLLKRTNYDALVSGDGACAGCGEKSVLRGVSSITEAFMRPLYHRKAERFEQKAKQVMAEGATRLEAMKQKSPEQYKWWIVGVKHLVLNLGGENEEDTLIQIGKADVSDADLFNALDLVMRQDAFNHRDLRAVDGRYSNGMSVMMMTSSTGCNSVYGSTHPANPHSYPWMNSLFQDSPTIAWAFGETLIMDHARHSVIPERLVDALLSEQGLSRAGYWDLSHFSDSLMTDQEILELPKVWAIGGDGAMGDIGFQNLSKVMLQNRPNVKCLMLDTQVYSNTGGQNSDSSVMPGGFDMNQFGHATEGKLVERKELTSIFMAGHGSPYVAQVSMANAASMYQSILDALTYRGTSYIQSFTTCQPEHGVADDVSTIQAQLVRDSRGMAELVFNPSRGETYQQALSLKGNPNVKRDWMQKRDPEGNHYNFTVAHWATTEMRFRKHLFSLKPGEESKLLHMDDVLAKVTQDDVVYRRHLDENHRSYIPQNGVYIQVEKKGKMVPMGVSRQMVLFCVERRKQWRLLQSMAGVPNEDYEAQQVALGK